MFRFLLFLPSEIINGFQQLTDANGSRICKPDRKSGTDNQICQI